MPTYKPGDRVVKNPATWRPSEFDAWGAGEGVGIVVRPPFAIPLDEVDVEWPSGRAFQKADELLPDDPARRAAFEGGPYNGRVVGNPLGLAGISQWAAGYDSGIVQYWKTDRTTPEGIPIFAYEGDDVSCARNNGKPRGT